MHSLPQTYEQLLEDIKNGSTDMSPLMFYSRSEIDEMNRMYNVGEFAPGALIAGHDGGDETVVLDLRENSATKNSFFFIPFISSGWKDALFAGNTMQEIITTYKLKFTS